MTRAHVRPAVEQARLRRQELYLRLSRRVVQPTARLDSLAGQAVAQGLGMLAAMAVEESAAGTGHFTAIDNQTVPPVRLAL